MNDWIIIKQGTWLYAGEVVCDIRILKHGWFYGSGDYEDEEGVREDRPGEYYYIEYSAAGERGVYRGPHGGYASLEEALWEAAVSTHQTVRWETETPLAEDRT